MQRICLARRDRKSQGCISSPSATFCSLLPGRFPAARPSLVFLPPWSAVRRVRATQTRRRATRGQDPQHAARAPIPAWPPSGGGGFGRASGCRLDSSRNDPNVRGCGLGLGASALQRRCASRTRSAQRTGRTQRTEEARGRRGSAPASPPRAPRSPSRRWLGPGSLSTQESRGRWARSRGTLPSARGHQPSGRPYLLGRRLLGGRRVWAMQPSGSVGPGHRGGGARSGNGGASGPRAADSALGRQQARARRAPLGPSRDRGGAPRTEDSGRARRVPGSGPFPPGLRVLAGAGGGDLVQPGSGAGRGSGVPEAQGVRGQAGKGSQPCAPGVSLSPGFCINKIGTRPSSQGCFEN